MSRVLLYSGGVDSLIAATLQRYDVLLFIDIGLPEQRFEPGPAPPGYEKIVYERRLYLADQKLPSEVVPLRNVFFAAIGAFYGNEVALASVDGDTALDKDHDFASLTQAIIGHVMSDAENTPERYDGRKPFLVSLPLRQWTKAEAVSVYLEKGGDVNALKKARSCYAAGEKECGVCRSCIRKYVALKRNGVGVDGLFATSPRDQLQKALTYAIRRERGRETEEIRFVLHNCN